MTALVFDSRTVLTALVAVAICAGWVTGCSRDEPPPAAGSCPASFSADANRTEKLAALLRGDPEARALLQRANGKYAVCYGDGEAVVDTDWRLRLPAREGDRALAARMAHLLTHVTDPVPLFDRAREPCEPWLAEVRRRETRAHQLESRLRQRFGLPPVPPTAVERVMDEYASPCRDAEAATD